MTAPDDQVVLGIDVGGTSIKGAIAGPDSILRARLTTPTPVADGVEAVLDAIVEMAGDLRTMAGVTPSAVGLAVPGLVDRAAGIARHSTNIGWRDLPIRSLVANRLGLPVVIDHDVRAAALAEVHSRTAADRSSLLLVSIGTGLATALVVDGAVVAGSGGQAGESGHVPVYPDGELCACGQRGCAEAYASAAAVARRYAVRTGDPVVGADEVFTRASNGDPAARAVLAEADVALTRMVLGCVLLADPAVIVLSGGMSGAGAAVTDPLSLGLRRSMSWREPPPVVVSTFGADAGLHGALLLAWSGSETRSKVV